MSPCAYRVWGLWVRVQGIKKRFGLGIYTYFLQRDDRGMTSSIVQTSTSEFEGVGLGWFRKCGAFACPGPKSVAVEGSESGFQNLGLLRSSLALMLMQDFCAKIRYGAL